MALVRWAMRYLAKEPKENVILLVDFNEAKPPGDMEQDLTVLFLTNRRR